MKMSEKEDGWFSKFFSIPKRLILLMVLFGCLIIFSGMAWYGWYCHEGSVPGGWCGTVRENPPWSLLAALATAPALLLTWYWKDIHKRADIEIAQEGQVTERFTRAIEQLGSEKLHVRLGAIYALERIAKDSPKDHWTIIETLAAFVRTSSPLTQVVFITGGIGDVESGNSDFKPDGLGIGGLHLVSDVQAALNILGRREIGSDPQGAELDLSEADLSGANLLEPNFSEANLIRTNFEQSRFWEPHFEEARVEQAIFRKGFFDHAHFEEAFLSRSHFEDSRFKTAFFEGASLFGAHFEGAKFDRVHFEGADLREAHFESSVFGVDCLDEPFFKRACFDGTQLEGARLDGAVLKGVDLRKGIGLTREQLSKATIDHTTKLPEEFADMIPTKPEDGD